MSTQISTAVTYSSQCAHSLLSILRQSLRPRGRSPSLPNPILLFAFAPSSTTPPEVLSDITSTLTQLYPEHVGCISAPLPYRYFDPKLHSGPHPCSLAYAIVNGVSFRSTISGRAETQVGRWHAARQRRIEDVTEAIRIENLQMRAVGSLSESADKVNWDDVWDRTGNSMTCSTLPDGLRNLDSSAVDNIFYLSDRAPEGLATVLEGAFPQANKLSLIVSSTPFITGRPVTLFYNGSIFSDGAVGIAFSSSPSSPLVELSFPPLVALSTNMNVTSSDGNLILSLDSGNPTKLLLTAIKRHGFSSSHTSWVGKEDEFYVGVIDPLNQQVSQLHRINAGDPSRGAISLDAISAPRQGSIVRLYHMPRDAVLELPTYVMGVIPNNISLLVSPETTPMASSGDKITNDIAANDDCPVVLNTFFAASENGFTLSHGAQGIWKCVVPGGRVRLSFCNSTVSK